MVATPLQLPENRRKPVCDAVTCLNIFTTHTVGSGIWQFRLGRTTSASPVRISNSQVMVDIKKTVWIKSAIQS